LTMTPTVAIAAVLERCGAQIKVVGSASEAQPTVERDEVDLLVADIEMPREDGFSLIGGVRALDPPKGRIPAIALTGHASGQDRERVLKAGFQEHVSKPVDAAALVAIVATVCSAHPSQED